MFTVQNAWSWNVFGCPRNEAWFWAIINETCYAGLVYNVYGPCGTTTMTAVEVAHHVSM